MSTSVSTQSQKSGPGRGVSSRPRLKTWVVVISTLALSLLIFFIVYTQGHVSGREFAPSHFQSRQFSFYEIPLLHIQITPIRRQNKVLPVATYVRQSSLVSTPSGKPETWHLVHLTRGLSGTTPADAHLLIDQLEMYGQNDTFWRKWSIDHGQHAAVLWPVVQRLAQRELYVLIPMVMELAQKDIPVSELTDKIDELLRRSTACWWSTCGRPTVANWLRCFSMKHSTTIQMMPNLRKLKPAKKSAPSASEPTTE